MMQYKLQASSRAAEQRMSSPSCLGRAAVPARRVWRGVTARLGLIRRGTTGKPSSNYVPMKVEAETDAPDAWLGGLRKEVRTCEYDDVHVMWEMLSSNTTGGGRDMPDDDIIAAATGEQATVTRRRARRGRKLVAWSRLVYYCCAL